MLVKSLCGGPPRWFSWDCRASLTLAKHVGDIYCSLKRGSVVTGFPTLPQYLISMARYRRWVTKRKVLKKDMFSLALFGSQMWVPTQQIFLVPRMLTWYFLYKISKENLILINVMQANFFMRQNNIINLSKQIFFLRLQRHLKALNCFKVP